MIQGIDLTKLSPAPWDAVRISDDVAVVVHKGGPASFTSIFHNTGNLDEWPWANESDADFIALARNAIDVMMRRGWYAALEREGFVNRNKWIVREKTGMCVAGAGAVEYPDPFTALVEADKWYRENIEKEPS